MQKVWSLLINVFFIHNDSVYLASNMTGRGYHMKADAVLLPAYTDNHKPHLSFIASFAYQGLLFNTFLCVSQHRKWESAVLVTLKYINDKLRGVGNCPGGDLLVAIW